MEGYGRWCARHVGTGTLQRDYLGTVEDVKINDRYAAVLSEGRVQVRSLRPAGTRHRPSSQTQTRVG